MGKNLTRTHYLKLNYEFCDDVYSCKKPFEIRKNDRDFRAGDHLFFKPYKSFLGKYTTHPIMNQEFEITYILDGRGLNDNYVAFAILPLATRSHMEKGTDYHDFNT